MKKFFFIAAIASAALVSCTKNEVITVADQHEITFSAPVVGPQTKAIVYGEIGANYNPSEDFKVYAVWHETNFDKWENGSQYMYDVVVSRNTGDFDTTPGDKGAWKPSSDYYWPKVGVLSFAAYSPATAEGTYAYGKDGLTITGFPVPNTTSLQYDLMFSERTYNKNQSENGVNAEYDGVDIKFKHALSSIRFTAATQADYSATTTIKVKKITMWGMNSKGNFEERVNDIATYDSAPRWIDQDTPVLAANPYVVYEGTLTLNKGAQNANSNDVILLPQVLPAGATIRVDYTMQTATGTEIPQYKEVTVGSLSGEWVLGKRYTYNIIVGLDDIYFAPSVEEWQDMGGVGSLGI